jgi:hypothetical protein
MSKQIVNHKTGIEISFGTTLTTASGGALIGGGLFGMPGAVVGAIAGTVFGIASGYTTNAKNKHSSSGRD